MEIWQVDTSSSNNDNQIVSLGSNLTNFPNPFNPSTEISFQISEVSEWESAEIIIYNIKGQKVKTFTFPNGSLGTSEQSVVWNGTDDNDKPVSSGVYFYQLKTNGKAVAQKKCLLLK
jgi:flagellar hook assembly protein FlgD